MMHKKRYEATLQQTAVDRQRNSKSIQIYVCIATIILKHFAARPGNGPQKVAFQLRAAAAGSTKNNQRKILS
jgi:hypothetical protein